MYRFEGLFGGKSVLNKTKQKQYNQNSDYYHDIALKISIYIISYVYKSQFYTIYTPSNKKQL